LSDKVRNHIVERVEVVVVNLAQFEKVERRSRAQRGLKVNLRR
jgi:hypothetical protein